MHLATAEHAELLLALGVFLKTNFIISVIPIIILSITTTYFNILFFPRPTFLPF